MKIKILPIFLLATTAAGAVLSAYLYQENRSLQAALEETSRVVPPTDELDEPLIPEPVVVVAAPTPEPVRVAEPEPRPQAPDRFDRFRQMMADPDFRTAMLERSKSRIERDFAGLFRALNLDEEGVGVFKTLLAERSMIERQAAFQRRSGRDDPETMLEAEFMLEDSEYLAESMAHSRELIYSPHMELSRFDCDPEATRRFLLE